MATEIAGFEIRDMINWVYSTSMPKGMSVARSIKTLKVSSEKKDELLEFYSNFKTPMIKSCFEPICVATKPRVDTYLNNELNFKTGLIDFSHKVGDNKVPANIITTEPIIDFLVRALLKAIADENARLPVKGMFKRCRIFCTSPSSP